MVPGDIAFVNSIGSRTIIENSSELPFYDQRD